MLNSSVVVCLSVVSCVAFVLSLYLISPSGAYGRLLHDCDISWVPSLICLPSDGDGIKVLWPFHQCYNTIQLVHELQLFVWESTHQSSKCWTQIGPASECLAYPNFFFLNCQTGKPEQIVLFGANSSPTAIGADSSTTTLWSVLFYHNSLEQTSTTALWRGLFYHNSLECSLLSQLFVADFYHSSLEGTLLPQLFRVYSSTTTLWIRLLPQLFGADSSTTTLLGILFYQSSFDQNLLPQLFGRYSYNTTLWSILFYHSSLEQTLLSQLFGVCSSTTNNSLEQTYHSSLEGTLLPQLFGAYSSTTTLWSVFF